MARVKDIKIHNSRASLLIDNGANITLATKYIEILKLMKH